MQIEALGIVLSTIRRASAVQGNYLVSHDVVSRSKSGRDFDKPAIIVGNQLVSRPDARESGVIYEAHAINLEELECRLINTLAGATTICKVGKHWPMVSRGPSSPLEVYLVSCSHHGMALGVGCVEMTDDIRRSVAVYFDRLDFLSLPVGIS